LAVASQGTQLVKLKDVARVELGRRMIVDLPLQRVSGGRDRRGPAVQSQPPRRRAQHPRSAAQHSAALPPGVKLQTAWDGSGSSRTDQRCPTHVADRGHPRRVDHLRVLAKRPRHDHPGAGDSASIVATFAIMYFLGFSINNFTLLALTIAIGIVVDDAIIVLENAFRHQEELHEQPEEAAVRGTNEIGFAVIATTIALVRCFRRSRS